MKTIIKKSMALLLMLTLSLSLLSPAFVVTTNASDTVTSPDDLTAWSVQDRTILTRNADYTQTIRGNTVTLNDTYNTFETESSNRSTESLDGSVFKAIVQFGDSNTSFVSWDRGMRLVIGSGDSAYGITIAGSTDGELQVYYCDNHGIKQDRRINLEEVNTTESLIGRELELMVTTEFVNTSQDGTTTDVNVGIYINGNLFTNDYYKFTNLPTQYLTQNVAGHNWNCSGEYFYLAAPEEEEDTTITSPDELTPWTTAKWPLQIVAATTTYPGHVLDISSGTSVLYNVPGAYRSTENMDDSVFKATIQFGSSTEEVAANQWNAGVRLALGTSDTSYNYAGLTFEGKPDGNLAFYYNNNGSVSGTVTTITPTSVGSDKALTGRELQLMVTTEFVNLSQDGTTTDVNVGIYINGKLFEDRYIVVEDVLVAHLTKNIIGHNYNDGARFYLAQPKEIITSPDELTSWTTAKWPLQINASSGTTYPGHVIKVTSGTGANYQVPGGYRSTDTMDDMVFKATIQFGSTTEEVANNQWSAGVRLALGTADSALNYSGLTLQGKPNGDLAFFYCNNGSDGTATTITPASVGSDTALTGRELQLMVTTEFVNTSQDGTTTDVKVGLYIDGVLFDGRYIVLEDVLVAHLTQNIIGHNYNDQAYFYLAEPKEIATSPDKLESWTIEDVWLGKYLEFSSSGLWTKGEQQTRTLDQKVFTADIQFVQDADSLGDASWGGSEYVRIILGSGFQDVGLVIDAVQDGGIRLMYCYGKDQSRNATYFTPEDFNWTETDTFIDQKIRLQVTTELFNVDLEEATADVKVGIYVNGVLGQDRCIVIEDVSLTAMVQNFSAHVYGKSSETMKVWYPENYTRTYAVKEPLVPTAKGWNLEHYVTDEATLEKTSVTAKPYIDEDVNRLQGMAIYNDTVFQTYNGGWVETYDLNTGDLYKQFVLGGATGLSDYHANQANFGKVFPEGNTEFPALYISTSAELGGCYVQSITKDSAELIQIIDFKGVQAAQLGSGTYIDTERNRLVCLQLGFSVQNKYNNCTIYEFDLPELTDGVRNEDGVLVVSLTDADVLTTYMLEYVPSLYQSGIVDNGRLVFIHGNYLDALGSNMAIVNYGVGTGSFDRYINLSGQINGGNQEPQAVSIYENEMYACFAEGELYKVRLGWDVPKTDYDVDYDYSLETVKTNIGEAVKAQAGEGFTIENVILPDDFEITQDAQAFTAKVALRNAYWVDTVSISGKINGRVENETIATITGSSLTLNGTLQANIVTSLNAEKTDGREIVMIVTMPNGTVEKMVLDREELVDNTYEFTFGIAAKEMTDSITLQLYCDDRLCDTQEYSVQTYAKQIVNGDYSSEAKTLAQALLNYGTCAQNYFNYNTSVLANPTLNPSEVFAEVDAQTLANYKKTTQKHESIAQLTSTNLVLESETTLKLYFTMAEDADVFDFDFKDASGNSLEVTQSGSRYYVTFADRKAHQLGEDVIVTITKKDDQTVTYTYSYSVLSYCYVALSYDQASEKLQNLAKSLYLYNQAAIAYQESIQ